MRVELYGCKGTRDQKENLWLYTKTVPKRLLFTSMISFKNFVDLKPLTRFSAILVLRRDWCVFLCLRALDTGCMQALKIQMLRQPHFFRCFPVFLLSEDL